MGSTSNNINEGFLDEKKALTTTISVTGGAGFIGKHLINALSHLPDLKLNALTRSKTDGQLLKAPNLRWFYGDLENLDALREFFVPSGVLVHLAYPTDWNSTRHLVTAEKLGRVAAEFGVKRVILCSTAVVVGNTKSRRVNEETICSPVSDYERTKLSIEQTFATLGKGAYQLAVLRPTAVLGVGGRNLYKLARALTGGSRAVNYLRSSLFGRRRMNLVSVDNVVSAFIFLIKREQTAAREVFIVSDDDDPMNNFRDIEIELMTQLGVANYPIPPFPVPQQVLSSILHLGDHSCTDPKRTYDGSRLVQAGYKKTSTITKSLEHFAASFKGINLNPA